MENRQWSLPELLRRLSEYFGKLDLLEFLLKITVADNRQSQKISDRKRIDINSEEEWKEYLRKVADFSNITDVAKKYPSYPLFGKEIGIFEKRYRRAQNKLSNIGVNWDDDDFDEGVNEDVAVKLSEILNNGEMKKLLGSCLCGRKGEHATAYKELEGEIEKYLRGIGAMAMYSNCDELIGKAYESYDSYFEIDAISVTADKKADTIAYVDSRPIVIRYYSRKDKKTMQVILEGKCQVYTKEGPDK